VGCGSGTVTQLARAYKNPNATLVATDLSEKMIELTSRRLGLEGAAAAAAEDKLQVKQADAESLPFADASFDRVFANMCIMLVPDAKKALLEARRVLKPGGFAAFTVWGRPENSSFMTIIPGVLTEMNLMPPSSERSNFHLGDLPLLRSLAVQCGFSSPLAWFMPVSFDIRTADEYVEKMSKNLTTQQLMSKVAAEMHPTVWLNVKLKVQSLLESSTPILFEIVVLVVSA